MVPGRLPSGSDWPVVLLHHVDVPVGPTEEEPAKAFHARVVEEVVCPDDVADQLDVRGRSTPMLSSAGTWRRVAADFSDELHPQLPQLASALPQPVTSAEVLSVDIGDSQSVAMIRYSGDSSALTVRSHWENLGGAHPVIVHAEPA